MSEWTISYSDGDVTNPVFDIPAAYDLPNILRKMTEAKKNKHAAADGHAEDVSQSSLKQENDRLRKELEIMQERNTHFREELRLLKENEQLRRQIGAERSMAPAPAAHGHPFLDPVATMKEVDTHRALVSKHDALVKFTASALAENTRILEKQVTKSPYRLKENEVLRKRLADLQRDGPRNLHTPAATEAAQALADDTMLREAAARERSFVQQDAPSWHIYDRDPL